MSKKKKFQKGQSWPPTASDQNANKYRERPISDAYPEIDNDLARDNLENDIPECDLPE